MTPDPLTISARDGTRLAADLYMPPSPQGRVPALLEALPYRKDDITATSHSEDYRRLSGEGGFAVCRVDLRGTGSSEGAATDEYPPSELDDLTDVIAWLASQPWCNGHVGMFGYSYSGFNSLQVACVRPPRLDAICAIYATDDRYTDDVHYMGGALRAIDLVDYCHYMTAMNALPPVPALFGDGWAAQWRQRIDTHEPWVLRWLAEQHDGPYWRHGSLRPDYTRIACPTMIVAGWADGYRNNTFRTFAALECERSLLVGPWSHMAPATSLPGPHIDLVPEMINWFDRWLRPGSSSAVDRERPIRIFMRHSTRPEPDLAEVRGTWRSDDVWPPPDLRVQTLQWDGDGIDVLTVRPDTGTAAWITCAGHLPWGQPFDQREDDSWSLTYDTPIGPEPMAILGHPLVRIRVAADQPVASLALKLNDVFPDGTSAMITRGFLNLTHRESSTAPSAVEPGKFMELAIELEATAWVIAPGHRVRLSITGADWPNTWVPPYTFTLHVDPKSLQLQLPVVDAGPGAGEPVFTPAPAHEPSINADADERAGVEWRIERDVLRRLTIARTRYGGPGEGRFGCRIDDSYVGEVGVSTVDPANGWATARTRYELAWPEGVCAVEARIQVRSDTEAFDVEIDLDADLDGAPFARRTWQRRIPRDLL